MLLAIDTGNTNIVFGAYDGARWTHTWRVQTVRDRMPDEYAVMFRTFLHEADLELDQIEQTVLSSVVPQLTDTLAEMIERRAGYRPLIVTSNTDTGIRIATDRPSQVGSDRIADAVAAYDRFHGDCIVVDFGTSTAFTIVREPGEMIGAVLAAGLTTTADAFSSKAAQLPHIELVPPPSIVGRNTIHAMQAGLVIGHVAMVEGLIARIKLELPVATVIATGGLARRLAPLTDCFDVVDPWLTLDGLRLIGERNPRV
jgi:type III pantothenate kinase